MRLVLFRGKRVDNGEWIEGFYAKSGDRTYIIIDNDFAVGYVKMKEVVPETVGQYTGATDKNDMKIFEGDIIKYIRLYDIGCYPHSEAEKSVVKYNNSYTGFYPICVSGTKNYEVIGNIYDNPELLKCAETDA